MGRVTEREHRKLTVSCRETRRRQRDGNEIPVELPLITNDDEDDAIKTKDDEEHANLTFSHQSMKSCNLILSFWQNDRKRNF